MVYQKAGINISKFYNVFTFHTNKRRIFSADCCRTGKKCIRERFRLSRMGHASRGGFVSGGKRHILRRADGCECRTTAEGVDADLTDAAQVCLGKPATAHKGAPRQNRQRFRQNRGGQRGAIQKDVDTQRGDPLRQGDSGQRGAPGERVVPDLRQPGRQRQLPQSANARAPISVSPEPTVSVTTGAAYSAAGASVPAPSVRVTSRSPDG